MQFEGIAQPVAASDAATDDALVEPPWNGQTPGNLPWEQAVNLADVLHAFTTTPMDIWFAIWEGWGNLTSEELASDRVRVGKTGRRYLLFRGQLADVARLNHYMLQPPDYWWPADHSWCVASDVDLYWTYVGGSSACVETLLAQPMLETVPAELSHRLAFDADPLNSLLLPARSATER